LRSALYLVGTVVVTSAFKAPPNEALAAVDPMSADAANLEEEAFLGDGLL
jgi:uncharacterized membrane protein